MRLETVAREKGIDCDTIEIWFADEARIGQRDRQSGRARCPCHPLGRSSWLALVDPPRRAGKHHHHCAAAKMPRAQSGRKCLAVHARQLALEPSLQILRRSRRPLLQRLEQAGRSALAHHVHWTAPMGARVLIKGNWYKLWLPWRHRTYPVWCCGIGLRALIGPNPLLLTPPGLTRGHDADRCICISQNFKDRRARAAHSD